MNERAHVAPAGSRRRRAVIAIMLVGSLVGVSTLVASPASASTIPTATVVGTPSVFNSNAEKTAEAVCPTGKRVVGGGVRVNAGDHVVVVREEPISTPSADSYLVTAVEDEVGTANSWALQAYAICTDPIPGLQIVAAVGSTGSSGFQGTSAQCPAGKNAVGAGGRILDGLGQVGLVTLIEGGTLGNTRTTAGGLEDLNGFAGNWSVIAYTVCVPLNSLFDMEVVKTFSVTDSTDNKVITATCPAGKRVTGGTGWADLPGVVASVNVDAARTRIQVVSRENDTSTSFTWRAIAMAFCVS